MNHHCSLVPRFRKPLPAWIQVPCRIPQAPAFDTCRICNGTKNIKHSPYAQLSRQGQHSSWRCVIRSKQKSKVCFVDALYKNLRESFESYAESVKHISTSTLARYCPVSMLCNLIPAQLAIIALAVDMLKVLLPSPPVPQVSMA